MANTLDLLRDGAVGFIDWLDAEFPFSFCESLNEFSFWSTFRVIGERESNIIELICLRPPACRISCKPFEWQKTEMVR